MIKRLSAMIPLALAAAGAASEPLRFEAEDWTRPKAAWVEDRDTPDHWNLWSTDKDAEKKWSGRGTVLRSPLVKRDRESPEDGAPPLHTKITGIPKGIYDVEVRIGRTVGVSLDGKAWRRFRGGMLLEHQSIDSGVLELWVDDRYANDGNLGAAYYDYVELVPYAEIVPKPRVKGWAKERVEERLDRGVVAVPMEEGVYVGWRLLRDDPAGLAFDVLRIAGAGEETKVNTAPVKMTCDFVDAKAPRGVPLTYRVRPAGGACEGAARITLDDDTRPYLAIRLDGDHTFQKCGLGDLDGDGRYDYVIKQPNSNIDPWIKYWKPSPDTYKIEAYTHDGRLLWRNDMGWAVERGIWYSPYIVHDLDGDGRAEVAAKVGEGDPRDDDGKVRSGPEWLVVWDGMTGRERARVPWPSREGFGDGDRGYNYAARNQIAVAYLDGRTPFVIALRGTYTVMKADAHMLHGGKLERAWTYSDSEGGRRYRGQGAHFTHCSDIDGDGRDEVILGSAVIDDNGSPLWSTGLGHPDHLFVGDIDPARAGLEIYYGIETRNQRNGMCLVDAMTGKVLWGYDGPTRHIHALGMCSDLDARHPGCEAYGADSVSHKLNGAPWLWSASGKLLSRDVNFGFGVQVAFWDADVQREIVRGGKIFDFRGEAVLTKIRGKVIQVADIIGDWREELVVSSAGELRVYTTTIPAGDRRVCLMQDPFYRSDVAMGAMGYTPVPMPSSAFEADVPNVSLTLVDRERGTVEVAVTAPRRHGVKGTASLSVPGGNVEPAELAVDIGPFGRVVREVRVRLPDGAGERPWLTATLVADGLPRRVTRTPL
jgi:rhamnogalacturonan endolyase